MFCRYVLRTLDVEAARRFYAGAIGLTLPVGMARGTCLEAWPLHERARAKGAPAHWLGLLSADEDDVEATVTHVLAAGGERLGPTVQASDGAPLAVLRDPMGAVVGVRAEKEKRAPFSNSPVAWHQLHTTDTGAAWSLYGRRFGWATRASNTSPSLLDDFHPFAFDEGGPAVGAMGNTARQPGVHTHWLYFFQVPDVEAAITRTRALGGTATNAQPLSDGRQVAGCHDPQGATFGLISDAPGAA